MKRKLFTAATIALLAGSVTFTSCIGPFNLTHKVLNWNNSVGGKFVNEVVFLAMCIVPVYGVCLFVDSVVLNSIEFWTGKNPVQAGVVKQIEGENGIYTVETLENGYNITNEEGETMSLLYDQETNIWSAVNGNESVNLVKIENDYAVVFLPNGEERNVALTADGVASFKEVVESALFYANK